MSLNLPVFDSTQRELFEGLLSLWDEIGNKHLNVAVEPIMNQNKSLGLLRTSYNPNVVLVQTSGNTSYWWHFAFSFYDRTTNTEDAIDILDDSSKAIRFDVDKLRSFLSETTEMDELQIQLSYPKEIIPISPRTFVVSEGYFLINQTCN